MSCNIWVNIIHNLRTSCRLWRFTTILLQLCLVSFLCWGKCVCLPSWRLFYHVFFVIVLCSTAGQWKMKKNKNARSRRVCFLQLCERSIYSTWAIKCWRSLAFSVLFLLCAATFCSVMWYSFIFRMSAVLCLRQSFVASMMCVPDVAFFFSIHPRFCHPNKNFRTICAYSYSLEFFFTRGCICLQTSEASHVAVQNEWDVAL